MVACGVAMLVIFACAFYFCARRHVERNRWLLRAALYAAIPLPWIASELGWVVAEYGRQPWTIAEILPTGLSASNLSAGQVITSLAGFVVFYSVLLVIELYLMFTQ